MPRLDKTGPEGKGQKTGRGRGKCSPEDIKKETDEIVKDTLRSGRGSMKRGFRGRR